MGTVKEKHFRSNRRPRSAQHDASDDVPNVNASEPKNLTELAFGNPSPLPSTEDPDQNIIPNPNFNDSVYDRNRYASGDELEEKLLNNLEALYGEAISRLVTMGYDEDTSLKAVLHNGHCYGSMHALTNIVINSLAYLNGSGGSGGGTGSLPPFNDLRHLVEYCLAGMICFLQQFHPELSKNDVMIYLLMNDLHMGRASAFEKGPISPQGFNNSESCNESLVGVTPDLCRFHGGWGFGSDVSELEHRAKSDDPVPPIEVDSSRRKFRTVARMFPKANASSSSTFRERSKHSCLNPPFNVLNAASYSSPPPPPSSIQTITEKMQSMSEEKAVEMIRNLWNNIKDLEEQVSARKEWAQEKAMQAARKLGRDLGEMKVLRMEREEEMQSPGRGKLALTDATMRRLSEMENSLRRTSGEVDRANAAVRWLQAENAEVRAEMEASKLSASESLSACVETARREKKSQKKLALWEKQRAKLQEQLTAERRKISEIEAQLKQIEKSNRDLEVKCREETSSRESTMRRIEMKRQVKEAAELDGKRRYEALSRKVEVDAERYKDDLRRLEEELVRLRSSVELGSSALHATGGPKDRKEEEEEEEDEGGGGMIVRLLRELERLEVSSDRDRTCGGRRDCLVCGKDDVSALLLPCAHQVLCSLCNEDRSRKECPCCLAPIEKRVRVFGAGSS